MDERRGVQRADGPEDAEAAMIMGNSTRAWDRFYDMRFQRRGAENAVNAMPQWRSQLLEGPSNVGQLEDIDFAMELE